MKRVIQFIIMALLFLCIYIEFDYQRYLKSINEDDEPIVDVVNGLSVNYMNGKTIRLKGHKKISFSITNFENENMSYKVMLVSQDYNQDISYELEREDDGGIHSTQKLSSDTILDDVTIGTGETHRYALNISNKNSNVVQLDLSVQSIEYNQKFYETILAHNDIKEANETGFDIATVSNEGLIKRDDGGIAYYFRGNISNNYVSFADMMWRIVGINTDHSVKLVLDGVLDVEANMSLIPDSEESILNTNSFVALDEWYNRTLSAYDSYISVSPHCFDNSLYKDENGVVEYLSEIRLFQDYLPSTKCEGTIISNKVALLSADEVFLAGGSVSPNDQFYLHVPNLAHSWWTMTPNKEANGVTSYVVVQNNGTLQKDEQETNNNYLRPVISLDYKTKVIGEGTKESPYVIID